METQREDISYLGKVVHVIDPDNFWMQIGTDENFAAFLQFELNLDEYCNVNSSCIDDISELHPGQHVLVDCTDSCGSWRRGQVSRVDSVQKCADVFYIDYGSTELVDEIRICTQLPDFITYPKQGLPCKIGGIKPIAKTWTTRAIKRFEELTRDSVFHTIVLPEDTGLLFKVILYQQSEKGCSISYIMLDEELAMPSDDPVTDFFVDVPEFYAQNFTPGPEAKKNGYEDSLTSTEHSQSTSEADNPSASSEGIPGFDMEQINHTKNTNTEKLHAKINRQNQKALEKETEKILQEINVMKAEAGYDDFESSGSEFDDAKDMFDKQGYSATNLDMSKLNLPDASNSSNKPLANHQRVAVKESSMSPKRYSKSRARENSNNKILGLNSASPQESTAFPRGKTIPNKYSSETVVLEHAKENAARNSPIGFKKRDGSAAYKGNSPSASYAKERYHSSRGSFSSRTWDSPSRIESPFGSVSKSGSTASVGPSKSDLDQASQRQENAEKDDCFPDVPKTLQQIFAEYDRENEQETKVRIKSLFSTEIYLYMDKEQMEEVIGTILNRTVRHYGYIHDVLLQVIETLSHTDDFMESMCVATRKIEENYIKIQTKGSVFHVHCSKVLGHLFNMSLHWDGSDRLKNIILSALEKWIVFNKKAQQIGQDRLQEIYLECFSVLWNVCGDSIINYNPEQGRRLESECRDKILNVDVSRNIRSKLLDVYIDTFRCPANNAGALPSQRLPAPFTEITEYKEKSCQTDPAASPVSGSPGSSSRSVPVPPGFSTPKVARNNSNTNISQREWPSLLEPKIPDWTARILEGQQIPDWPSPDEVPLSLSASNVLITPQSFQSNTSINSSAYFTPDEYKFKNTTENSNPFSEKSFDMVYKQSDKINEPLDKGDHNQSHSKNQSLKEKRDQSDDLSSLSWANHVGLKCDEKMKKVKGRGTAKEKNNVGNVMSGMTEVQDPYPRLPSVPHQQSVNSSVTNKGMSLRDITDEWLSSLSPKTDTSQNPGTTTSKETKSKYTKIGTKKSVRSKSSCDHTSDLHGKPGKSRSVTDWFSMEGEVLEDVKAKSRSSTVLEMKKDLGTSKERQINDWFSMDEEDNHEITKEQETSIPSSTVLEVKKDPGTSKERQINDWFSMDEEDKHEITKEQKKSSPSSTVLEVKKDPGTSKERQINDWFSMDEEDEIKKEQKTSSPHKHVSKKGANDLSVMSALVTHDDYDDDDDDDEFDDYDDVQWETESSDNDNTATSNVKPSKSGSDSKTSSGTNNQSLINNNNEKRRWNPGKKICTVCGSESHLSYDCPRKHKNNYLH